MTGVYLGFPTFLIKLEPGVQTKSLPDALCMCVCPSCKVNYCLSPTPANVLQG